MNERGIYMSSEPYEDEMNDYLEGNVHKKKWLPQYPPLTEYLTHKAEQESESMNEIQRYMHDYHAMPKSATGDYVLYSDHCEAIKDISDTLRQSWDHKDALGMEVQKLTAERDALQAMLVSGVPPYYTKYLGLIQEADIYQDCLEMAMPFLPRIIKARLAEIQHRDELLEADIREMELYRKRYEALRVMTPVAFTQLWKRNLQEGKTFDALVDEIAVEEHHEENSDLGAIAE